MKLCPQCLTSYDDRQVFCSQCGCRLVENPEDAPEEPAAPPEEEPVTVEKPAAEPEAGPEPERRPEPEKRPEQGKKKPPVGAGRRILAALLCVFLFVFLLVPSLGFAARRATTEKGMEAVLAEIDLGGLRIDPYFDDVNEELELGTLLAEDLDALNIGLSLSEKSVGRILRNSSIKSYLAGQLSALLDDVYSGRSRYEYDPGTLRDELLEAQTVRALEKEGVSLNREQAGAVAAMITRYGVNDLLSRDELRESQPELYTALHIGLSYFTLGAVLLLAVLVTVLIFRVNRRAGWSFGDLGGTLIAVGAIPCLAALAARLLPGLWQSLCGDNDLIAAVSGGVLWYHLRISLIVLGAGVLLAILGRILRGAARRRLAREG